MKFPRSLWRAASGRWRLAVLIAVAVVLPGGVGAGTMAMMPNEADPSSLPGLNGALPFQEDEALEPYLDADMLAAVPVGEDPVSEPVRAVLSSSQVIDSLGESGIPSVAVDAYVRAAGRLATEDPSCGIRWTLLAAIGRVESNHGRFGGAMLRDDGYPTKPILGLPLDGRANVALIRDTDRGRLDRDTRYDRAVGPMQFIPSTWESVGVDGNGDGRRDPNNLFDAAYGAARYLCDGDRDLRNADARAQAVLSYNNADEYKRVVLSLADMYETGAVQRLPAIGLPPMEPTPPPRPSPGPPPSPNGPIGPTPGPERPSAPAPRPAPPRPIPPAAPNPAPPAPPRSAPNPPAPNPPAPTPTPSTTAPPTTIAPPPPPTTVTPSPPPPTTSSTTTPPTTAPEPSPSTTTPTTVPADPPPEPPAPPEEPPAPPEEPPAAVGWAPAMREVVVEILEESADPPAPAAPEPPAPEPPAPEPPADPPEVEAPPESVEPPASPAPPAPPEPTAPAEPPPADAPPS
jgi:Transglycosylase SLT domain